MFLKRNHAPGKQTIDKYQYSFSKIFCYPPVFPYSELNLRLFYASRKLNILFSSIFIYFQKNHLNNLKLGSTIARYDLYLRQQNSKKLYNILFHRPLFPKLNHPSQKRNIIPTFILHFNIGSIIYIVNHTLITSFHIPIADRSFHLLYTYEQLSILFFFKEMFQTIRKQIQQ